MNFELWSPLPQDATNRMVKIASDYKYYNIWTELCSSDVGWTRKIMGVTCVTQNY